MQQQQQYQYQHQHQHQHQRQQQPANLVHVETNQCGSAPCPRAPVTCTSPSSSLIDSNRLLGPQHHHRALVLLPRHGVFVLLAVLLCRFGAWLPSLCSRTHHPDRSCARRNLDSHLLWGSLPSSLGSLPGLTRLYVVVLSVSASACGATNALVFAAARVFVVFLPLAVLLCRFGAWLPIFCSRTHAPPRLFVRAQVA